jgi:hypothetical protein
MIPGEAISDSKQNIARLFYELYNLHSCNVFNVRHFVGMVIQNYIISELSLAITKISYMERERERLRSPTQTDVL